MRIGMRSRRIPSLCAVPTASKGVPITTLRQTGGPTYRRPPPRCRRASLGPSGSETRTHTRPTTQFANQSLLTRDHRHRGGACHYRGLSIGRRAIHADHLSRFRWDQTDAPGQHVNPLGIAQRSIFQAQRMVHLGSLTEFTLGRFDLVAVLDRLEVLPGISKDQQEQASQRGTKWLHLAVAPRIFHLDQTRVVDRLGEVDLGCTCPKRTTPCLWIRTANCYRCCCHYAAPMKTRSPSVNGICMAKIACSSCCSAICCRSALWSTRSTIAIKSLINVPVYMLATSIWIPTTEPGFPASGFRLPEPSLLTDRADLCPL